MTSEVSLSPVTAPESRQSDRWISLTVLVATVPVLLVPLWKPEWFPAVPAHGPRLGWAGLILAGLLPGLAAWLTWRWWPQGRAVERGSACLAFALLSLWCTDLHYSNVDLGHYAPGLYVDNVHWQREMQDAILRLDPLKLPHSYRFLPNCVVAWLQELTGNYLLAALIYRLTTQWILLLSIYRLARLCCNHSQAILALLLYALAYVPSLRYYAGQLTDPLSHLSFVLGCLFIATQRPWPFFVTIVLGVLAKESVLALAVFPLLWWIRSPREVLRWCPAFVAGMGLALLVRWRVVGQAEYEHISGVTPGYVISNLQDSWHWSRQTWQTVGALWLVALLRWNTQPLLLRRLTWFLFPCLWVSSLFFSHLKEARNLIPVSVLLAIQAARVILPASETIAEGATGGAIDASLR